MKNDKTETETETPLSGETKLDPFKRIEVARKALDFFQANDVEKKRDLFSILKIIASAVDARPDWNS